VTTIGSGSGATPTTRPPRPVPAGSTTTTPPLRPATFVAQSASFVTEDEGFVLGLAPCPSGACTAVRQTLDRGQTWQPVAAPPVEISSPYNGGVSGLHFADRLDGWVYGSTLWATHDGAASWHQVNLLGQIMAMASGAGEAYALVLVCSACTGGSAAIALFRSPASEDDWTRVPGAMLSQLGPDLVVEGSTVFVEDASQILSSANGVDFEPLPIPCVPEGDAGPFALAALAASDPSDVAVACTGGAAAGSVGKELFISSDGGHTYQRVQDPPFGGDFTSLAMPSPTTVFLAAASGASELYETIAPDAAWTTPLSFGDGGEGLDDLQFVDPSSGVLIHGSAELAVSFAADPAAEAGQGTLYVTDDGGSTWSPVAIGG
jgi:photosystem II stability/assembly factor-like uncharacterized protein